MNAKAVSAERLLEYLRYEPETGRFYWTKDVSRRLKAGSRAGSDGSKNYRQIMFRGEHFQEHRLAWFFVHREWPDCQIDHRDLNKMNNAIGNLREATPSQNKANSAPMRGKKVALKGVTFHKDTGKFMAQIAAGGRHRYLGLHATAEAAHAAYCEAARQVYGDFARVS